MSHNKVMARKLQHAVGAVYEVQNKEVGFGFLNLS